MIWIVGGTSEGRELVERIRDLDFIVSLATEDGREFISTDKFFVGRMNKDEMIKFAIEYGIKTIVDLSHPYAKIVSKNAKEVSGELNLTYLRYIRKVTTIFDGIIYLSSFEECYDFLNQTRGTMFFTTGSKNIKDFEKVKTNNRHIYRVLPAIESLEICKKNNIHMRDIVANIGPFSKEYNKTMFKEYGTDYVIMKDSGENGGTIEKVQACMELGIKPIIIGRDDEEGYNNLEELERIIREIKQEE